MSTSCTKNSENTKTVVARAYGNRPLRLNALVKDGRLKVFSTDPALLMGWPAEDVFCDEPGTFETLKAAWERGDEKALAEAWKCAKPITLT